MSGPEATAGSTLIFLKKRGINIPTALEISIAKTIETIMQEIGSITGTEKNAFFSEYYPLM